MKNTIYKIKKTVCGWGTVLLLLFIFNFISCSENDCSLGGRPSVRFSFMNSKTHAIVNLFDSLTVTALDTDSILLNRGKGINHITLPLSYVNEETTFVLHYSRFLRDTIWVKHENYPHFISMDCGISMFYTLKEVQYTTYLLDSITLVNPDINDNEKDNYHIYYTPDN
ncbi:MULTISPECIES: DUF6452 family protein [unclassified Bacteroides]|jgi:hypothetical protein|uniref:DUF6452 family protein n=1 Tax=unclassified Bacteroides TaxID=2646097 RepID=UPI000E9AD4AB|nr:MULTISPECIES: DUF6452 family protein [unclassified Bacteroides]RGN47360.1 calcium-binding protein P [Bacteroides sp. OM05-12]RHR74984.1 calcium-binding protein P [Bacteroides sp. AF16-49]